MDSAEIDKELEDVEVRIDQTRAYYEQYFMGMERVEPQKPRLEIERRIKVLRKEQIRNTAQRFKFNMLVQRFNTLQQYWGRVVREIENGTFKRDVVKAAARFGDGALTGVAKKRAKELAKVAAQQAKRAFEDAMELGAEDLIEDDEDELDPPTPPRRDLPPVAPRGLYPTDLPLVGGAPAPAVIAPAAPVVAVPQRTAAFEAAAVVAPPAPPPSSPQTPAPKRSAGLRWGSSDPSSSIRPAPGDVKRRVAELAAEMRTGRPQDDGGPSFGALDLDFDDGPGSRRAAVPAPDARGSAPPGARAGSPGDSASGGFGVLDIPFGSMPEQPAPVPSPSSPGSGIRMGGGRPQPARAPAASGPRTAVPRAPPPPAAAPAPPAAAAPSAGDLGDQRLRQIYAKYVETKRSVNESTAGVTYDRLAETLRAQAEKLRQKHPSKSIDYEVVVKDGKTHLKPVLR
jgi:hypothetical protein